MLSWFWAIEAFQTLGMALPVNIRFVLEGMEESGSVGLDDLVDEMAKPSGFLDGIDFMAISDNYWYDIIIVLISVSEVAACAPAVSECWRSGETCKLAVVTRMRSFSVVMHCCGTCRW